MKLTLEITCKTYDLATALRSDLGKRGFNAMVCCPCANIYHVTVSVRPEHVNYGDTMFEELETALAVATVFLREEAVGQ